MRQETPSGRTIQAVLEEHTSAWMRIEAVVGTGIGLCDDAPCLVVFVTGDIETVRKRLPERVEGYRIDVRRSGEFRALDSL